MDDQIEIDHIKHRLNGFKTQSKLLRQRLNRIEFINKVLLIMMTLYFLTIVGGYLWLHG